ncbi:MAG: PQQ-binding-like beta-propeller repeat protein [Planctomycetota bacterium]|nr:PQQ-binding-like beta-propeller repeat protein [Planctomycetota bacterium]
MRLTLPHRKRYSVLMPFIVVSAVFFSIAAVRADAADWPNWRGPNHNGISGERGWMKAWLEEEPKVLWEKSVGVGYSSVAVVGDRVYTMGNKDGSDIVWCLNADTGTEVWKHSYSCPRDPAGGYSGPRATPTVNGKHVFTMSHNGQVLCLDADSGEVAWNKNVPKELNAGIPQWGLAGSPLVAGKEVILNVGTAGVALDKTTGKIVWRTGGGMAGYATPVLFEAGGREYLVVSGATSIAIVNAANGDLIDKYAWRNSSQVNAADPIISGDKIFISADYGKGCALLKFSGDNLNEVWRNKEMRNHFNSCVLWKGHLYGFDKSGLKCMDFATGGVKWSRRGFGRESSLMIADGKMIMMEERGTLVVAEPSPNGYKELARKRVLSGTCWTTPVLSGGRIFCRNHQGTLLCLKVGPKPPRVNPKPAANKPKPRVVLPRKKPQAEPSDPAAGKLGLAKSYLASGRKEKAKTILKDIVQNHKNSVYARDAVKLLESIR